MNSIGECLQVFAVKRYYRPLEISSRHKEPINPLIHIAVTHSHTVSIATIHIRNHWHAARAVLSNAVSRVSVICIGSMMAHIVVYISKTIIIISVYCRVAVYIRKRRIAGTGRAR